MKTLFGVIQQSQRVSMDKSGSNQKKDRFLDVLSEGARRWRMNVVITVD